MPILEHTMGLRPFSGGSAAAVPETELSSIISYHHPFIRSSLFADF
jgi:hypothetical protein